MVSHHGQKNLRAQEIALENRLPIIYLVDSAGVYLPMQDEIFPDKEHFGRMFRNNARLSSAGIPQIAAVMGSCVAGGAYLPIMSDESIIVEGSGSIFLAGSYLVKAAIGETIDNETLGGAATHDEISGVTDYRCKDEEEALNHIRTLVSHWGDLGPMAGFHRESNVDPNGPSPRAVLPDARTEPYDTYELIASLVDADSFTEYKKGYGKTLVCGYARIDGWSVGIVANQRSLVKSKKTACNLAGSFIRTARTKPPASSPRATSETCRLCSSKTSQDSWSGPAPNTEASSKTVRRWSMLWPTASCPNSPSLWATAMALAIMRCAARPTIPVSLWRGRPRALP